MIKRNAQVRPIYQSISGMITEDHLSLKHGLFIADQVMERHNEAETADATIPSPGWFGRRHAMTPAEAIRSMFPADFDDADDAPMGDPDEYSDDDDDLPDPATMDWEPPYWSDPEVDDDLLIAARMHREHCLALGLED